MMNMHQLEVLSQIAQRGSFSGAALALDTSQAAVSRAIAALEKELGVPLLTRGRFGAQLTPVGERILSHSHKILDLREMIEYEANLEKGLYGGRVRIASFRSAATHVLPPHIAQFSAAYPKVEVSLSERDPAGVEQALRSGQADIGLVPLPRSSDDFDTWEIVRDEYVVLLPKTFTWGDQSLSWEILSSHTFILYNYAECTSTVRDYWAVRGHPLRVAYEIREDSTIVSMVAQGLGAAILPRLAAMPIPEDINVFSLPVPLERVIGVATLANSPRTSAVEVFLNILKGQ